MSVPSNAAARPDFTKIELKRPLSPDSLSLSGWENDFKKETGLSVGDMTAKTMEQIALKPLYTEADYEGLSHLGYTAGIPPFLRGPYPTLFVTRPWTVRQYAWFSKAE